MSLAPIVLFVYNRPEHTKKTIEALSRNEGASESEIFIYSDGPKVPNDPKVTELRNYLTTVTGFKNVTVKLSETNKGLANSVINGVTEIVNRYGRVIVLEDDLITLPFFLKYMNEALERYESEKKVFAVTGYSYFPQGSSKLPETYFLQNMCSWTWATWKDRWEQFDPDVKGWEKLLTDKKLARKFDHNGFDLTRMLKAQMVDKTINSWAVRWCYSAFINGGLSLFPNKSLVTNVGFDGSGTNCPKDTDKETEKLLLADKPITFFPEIIAETPETYREINKRNRNFHIKHYKERIVFYMKNLNKVPGKIMRIIQKR